MGQAIRKFEVIEGGSSIPPLRLIDEPIDEPLMNLGKWLDITALGELAGVSYRAAAKAVEAGRWRGADLMIRQVEIGRGGAGGMAPQVHVDSLPADLRAAWYAQHGIALHEAVDAATGETRLIPEDAGRNDHTLQERMSMAQWRLNIIRSAVSKPKGSAERKAALDAIAGQVQVTPNGKRKTLARSTLYNWVSAYDAAGSYGLLPSLRKDKGTKKAIITLTWDQFFSGRISAADLGAAGEKLTHYIRSLWASGESGWRAITEKSTTRLIEISRELRDVQFDALPLGAPSARASTGSQFGVCTVSRRLAEAHRDYQIVAIRNKDNARYQDTIAPTIRRDYSQLKPREIVVGDVHPMDVMVIRPDGSKAYPKAISWFDPSTNEIHMTVVLLEKGEGIRREHVAMSFEAMVGEWGLPKMLYLDNGSEYSWAEMLDGFTELTRLVNVPVKEFGEGTLVDARVSDARQAVIRSLAYNAKGKPGIEGAFGNLEQVFFSNMVGWTAGDRMRKKTYAKGKDPIPFPGDMAAFMAQVSTVLEWYHKRPQYGRLDGRSPNEALRAHIEGGWAGKVVPKSAEVLQLAFGTVEERVVDRGVIVYAPRDGRSQRYYCDELLAYPGQRITVRVPAYNPDRIFCFNADGELIGRARPEQTYHPLDPAGAAEGAARTKVLRREVSDKAAHVAMLDLVDETARHIRHLPEAPEVPIAAVIDAGLLDRLAQLDAEDRASLAAPDTKPKRAPSQWGNGPNEALANAKFEGEDE